MDCRSKATILLASAPDAQGHSLDNALIGLRKALLARALQETVEKRNF